ncbi:MAG: hypothetical protein V1767_06090 [Chloroflexota bacterium]
MKQAINIGIIGDFNPNLASHNATVNAINHAANHLSFNADIAWLATPSLLTSEGQKRLEQCDGFWATPGSYKSQEGALKGIRFARENNRPFVGT